MTNSLPQPERYVVSPAWVIQSAFDEDPPKRALLANYLRLLSLAWENKYECTPPMLEKEIMIFMRLERRQFFQAISEMVGLHWLRSERPRPGFVQYHFEHRNGEVAVSVDVDGAENRTVSAENRTVLKRIEEEELIKLKDSESSSSILQEERAVRKIAQVQKTALTAETPSEKKMQLLVENLRLIFEPETYGLLEMREIFLAGIPERVLGWIAKAYQDRPRLDAPLALIVKHIVNRDAPDRYYVDSFRKILPEEYLEAVGEIEYECDYCETTSGTRMAMQSHVQEAHPFRCLECTEWFVTQEALANHYNKMHDPLTRESSTPAFVFVIDELVTTPIQGGKSAEQAWRSVLGQLQMEMPRASFETWARDTRAVRYGGNTLTVGVRNIYALSWLQERMTSTINRLLVGILNDDDVCVEFVVPEGDA